MSIGKTVRKAIQLFADQVDTYQDRMSHDDIIHACSISTPSIIGMRCVCVCYAYEMTYRL